MIIPKEHFQTISLEISGFIGNEITITDLDGTTIANSMGEQLNELDTHIQEYLHEKQSEQYQFREFSEKYQVIVIYFRENPLVLMHIKGPLDLFKKHCRFIKSITELMISEKFQAVQRNNRSIDRNNFIERWLFSTSLSNDTTFEACAKISNIDLSHPQVVVVLNIHPNELLLTDAVSVELITHLKKVYRQDLLMFVKGNTVYLIIPLSDPLELQRTLKLIKPLLEVKFNLIISGGISPITKTYLDVPQFLRKAIKAATISVKSRKNEIVRYEELSIDLLVEDIPVETKEEFLDRVFSKCTPEEVDEYSKILITYFVNNKSITKSSSELFMHKNTLQYKLNKIQDKTGYDPHIICDSLKLYIAILFAKSLRPNDFEDLILND